MHRSKPRFQRSRARGAFYLFLKTPNFDHFTSISRFQISINNFRTSVGKVNHQPGDNPTDHKQHHSPDGHLLAPAGFRRRHGLYKKKKNLEESKYGRKMIKSVPSEAGISAIKSS